jgi:hypothetical protein
VAAADDAVKGQTTARSHVRQMGELPGAAGQ